MTSNTRGRVAPNPRRQWLRTSLGLGAALAGAWALEGDAATSTLVWRERALLGFGTTLWLRAAHRDPEILERALDAAVQSIRHVESQMSLFDPASALSRLNRDGELRHADADLLQVLRLAHAVAARSDGAFDITVQPLWQAWDTARRAGRAPSGPELSRARALVGWRNIDIDDQRVRLGHPGMGITLNGIAQGYAADLARERLRARGVEHALLDTGEWAPLGHGPRDLPWTLAVENPRAEAHAVAALQAQGRSVATSSDAHSAFTPDLRHHHIFDPRTGQSPARLASVTVVAPSCALADALTKVMFMGDIADALRLARRWNVDVLAIDKAGRWQASPGLRLARRAT